MKILKPSQINSLLDTELGECLTLSENDLRAKYKKCEMADIELFIKYRNAFSSLQKANKAAPAQSINIFTGKAMSHNPNSRLLSMVFDRMKIRLLDMQIGQYLKIDDDTLKTLFATCGWDAQLFLQCRKIHSMIKNGVPPGMAELYAVKLPFGIKSQFAIVEHMKMGIVKDLLAIPEDNIFRGTFTQKPPEGAEPVRMVYGDLTGRKVNWVGSYGKSPELDVEIVVGNTDVSGESCGNMSSLRYLYGHGNFAKSLTTSLENLRCCGNLDISGANIGVSALPNLLRAQQINVGNPKSPVQINPKLEAKTITIRGRAFFSCGLLQRIFYQA